MDRLLIGIVLDSIDIEIRNIVKKAFVLAFKKDEVVHDLAYFYQSGKHEIPNKLSKTVSALLMAKPEKDKIYDALAVTFNTMKNETSDEFQQIVIVITDNYKKSDEFSCLSILRQQDISYVFLGVGEKYDRSLNNLGRVIHADNDDLKDKILDLVETLIKERDG